MSGARSVRFLGVAPIPIDHRVEVRWYQEIVPALLGGTTVREESEMPWIEDLDTGVVYAGHWLFCGVGVDHHRVNVQTREVRPTLRLIESIVGRVVACQVTTVNTTQVSVETLLVVAQETKSSVYR